MRLGDIYRKAVQLGMDHDPRTKEEILFELHRAEAKYERMGAKEKGRFDTDALWNPYADSRLLFGDPDREVRGILWGIDISPAEIILADRLREKGRAIDAVIGHHPRGKARPNFQEVMHIIEYMAESAGVPMTQAEDILAPRIRDVHLSTVSENINQSVDAARLLEMPMMCLHSCTDNLVQRHIEELMSSKQPQRVEDVLGALLELPEIDHMARYNNPPEVVVGDRNRRAGKIFVKMTGGTSIAKELYEKLADAGIGTVVCMHVPENHIEEAKKHHINIVISGHMGSDSLGVNLLADRVEAEGVEIVPCSGLVRVRRD